MRISASKIVEVFDGTGGKHLAQVYVCDACEGETFHIFLVHGKHQHLQCVACGVSYCDGTCHHDAQAKDTRQN